MYYKLEFETWTPEWERVETFFYKNKVEARNKHKELSRICPLSNRGYITEISFEQLKEEITVSDFELLFGICIREPNGEIK